MFLFLLTIQTSSSITCSLLIPHASWYLQRDTCNLILKTWYLISDTLYLILDIWCISLHTTVSYSIVSYCTVMFTPLAWLARQWTSTPWLSHSWPRAYHSAHLPSIPRSQPRNCGAVEPALYSLEDLGLNIVNKQHIDPAHQQQHHDVLDCKQNQAPMITWPPWKTGKAKNVQKKYKNSNLSHNFTIWG